MEKILVKDITDIKEGLSCYKLRIISTFSNSITQYFIDRNNFIKKLEDYSDFEVVDEFVEEDTFILVIKGTYPTVKSRIQSLKGDEE